MPLTELGIKPGYTTQCTLGYSFPMHSQTCPVLLDCLLSKLQSSVLGLLGNATTGFYGPCLTEGYHSGRIVHGLPYFGSYGLCGCCLRPMFQMTSLLRILPLYLVPLSYHCSRTPRLPTHLGCQVPPASGRSPASCLVARGCLLAILSS